MEKYFLVKYRHQNYWATYVTSYEQVGTITADEKKPKPVMGYSIDRKHVNLYTTKTTGTVLCILPIRSVDVLPLTIDQHSSFELEPIPRYLYDDLLENFNNLSRRVDLLVSPKDHSW